MSGAATLEKRDRIIKTEMPHELAPPIGARAAIGLLVLSSDQTIEYEWRRILNLDGVAFFENRLFVASNISPETLAAMAGEIGKATSLILPSVPLDVVAYGCTSGAMTIGEERVFELIRAERPGVACTTPITGAIAGLEALGVRRIAMLTPYVESVNEMMRSYLEARGIEVPVSGSFTEDDDRRAARISGESIRAAALDLGRTGGVEAVFVSCTSLKLIDIIQPLEDTLDIPVLSSNIAMAWHALRLAGVDDVVPGCGRLFAH